jgi:peroxiredoxin
VSSTGLLAQGPLLITFYRGEWCPFCNVALSGLQKHAEAFRAKGVTLVAISPELPNTSLTTVEKNALQFPVLSDVRNEYARKLGIVWEMPVYLKPIFKNFGTDLETRNGDGHFEVPVPATILVDKNGIVKNTYIDPDYTKRLDPEVALTWTNDL